jgi:hypothetical protein
MPELEIPRSDLQFLITESPPHGGKRPPAWIRTVFVHVDTKTVYVSCCRSPV